jgi:hypothetical protein
MKYLIYLNTKILQTEDHQAIRHLTNGHWSTIVCANGKFILNPDNILAIEVVE